MTNPHLTLVAPTTIIGTVGDRPNPPRRKRNAEVRAREYLTDGEIDAGGKNRYGHRDAIMVLVAYRHGLRATGPAPAQTRAGPASPFIFTSERGAPFTPAGFRKMVARL